MAESDRAWLTAVLAADPGFEIRTDRLGLLEGDAHQLSNSIRIDREERVVREDSLRYVVDEESALGIVTADAVGHLRQVVRAERDELRILSDLIGRERRSRNLDHRAELVVDLDVLLRHDVLGLFLKDGALALQFVHVAGQRNHDLGVHVDTLAGHLACSLEDRPDLHPCHLGTQDSEAHAAQTKHRVLLLQGLDPLEHLRLLGDLGVDGILSGGV